MIGAVRPRECGNSLSTKGVARRERDQGDMMARKTSKSASKDVESAMHKRKKGTLKSGGSGKKVTSKKQAIAIGLSEARRKGKKVAKKPAKKSAKKAAKKATKKS